MRSRFTEPMTLYVIALPLRITQIVKSQIKPQLLRLMHKKVSSILASMIQFELNAKRYSSIQNPEVSGHFNFDLTPKSYMIEYDHTNEVSNFKQK
jgi:hypothetical protein